MKINCPHCKVNIDPSNVNASKDIAFCVDCNEGYKISSLVNSKMQDTTIYEDTNDSDTEYKDYLSSPPKGIVCNNNYGNTLIKISTRSKAFFVLFPFTIIWSSISLVGTIGSQSSFNLWNTLFSIPFLIGAVALSIATLMTLCGKIEINIGSDSYVFKGIGFIGLKKRFEWNDIHSVSQRISNTGESIKKNIYLEGTSLINCRTNGLSEEKSYFALQALRQLLRERY